MQFISSSAVQYANNLASSRNLVLRADRVRGDEPLIELYSDSNRGILVAKIVGGVKTEPMLSNPCSGNKSRTDIHISLSQLKPIIDVLTPFVNSLHIDFDDAPRSTPDPTGTEYPGGLSLGETKPITNFAAEIIAYYEGQDFLARSKHLYLDAEKYSLRKGRFHIGATSNEAHATEISSMSSFELRIPYAQTKRFLLAMNVAEQWLK